MKIPLYPKFLSPPAKAKMSNSPSPIHMIRDFIFSLFSVLLLIISLVYNTARLEQ